MSSEQIKELREGDIVMARWPYNPEKLVLLIKGKYGLYGPGTSERAVSFDSYGHPTQPDTWKNAHSNNHEVVAVIGNWLDHRPDQAALDLGVDIVEAVEAAGYKLVKASE